MSKFPELEKKLRARELQLELLNDFGQRYQSAWQDASELHQSEQFDQGRKLAHTIKGVCANLGLGLLNQASKQLEQAFAEQQNIADSLITFKSALEQTLAQIYSLSEEPVHQQQSTQSAELSSLQTLLQKVRNNLFISPEEVDALLGNISTENQTKTAIKQAIDALEYPTALTLLEKLKDSSLR